MKKIVILSTLAGLLLTPTYLTAQKQWHIDENKKKKSETTAPPAEKKPDQQIKDYSKVITKDAISDDGLFTVHKVDKKYFFEIPNTLLNKDMLLVSRLSKLPSNLGGGYVNA
ncbi:MAG: DUF5118 domain-containing protein, partial [Bacteroidetes bacterium]|nr:DUF5118 domain-containing protein [Bacteroidota bacterium]